MLQKVMSHITAVKKDMIILEKSEFSALLAENEVRLCRMMYYHHPLCILYSMWLYTTAQRFRVSKIKKKNWKRYHAHQCCIYLIKFSFTN